MNHRDRHCVSAGLKCTSDFQISLCKMQFKTSTNAEFRANTDILYLKSKSSTVESVNSVKIVEMFHATIRCAFNVTLKECPEWESEKALQMIVKSVDVLVAPNGLTPALIVFFWHASGTWSTYRKTYQVNILECYCSSKCDRFNVSKICKRQIRDTLCTRNGPDVTDIYEIPSGTPVFVYRLDRIGGKDCTLEWI